MMKKKSLALTVAALLAMILVACGPVALQPTATPKPTVTAQPTKTAAPTSTPIPPTEIPPSPTFPATLTVNGVDAVQVLVNNGFTYAGGPQVGACASSCAVYDNAKLDLRVLVYSDGTVSSTTKFGLNASAQADVMFAVVDKIYGTGMADWITNRGAAVLQGQAQDGKVGNFTVHMESPGGSVIALTITPSK